MICATLNCRNVWVRCAASSFFLLSLSFFQALRLKLRSLNDRESTLSPLALGADERLLLVDENLSCRDMARPSRSRTARARTDAKTNVASFSRSEMTWHNQ